MPRPRGCSAVISVVSISIHPQAADDAERLVRALERLTAEDTQLRVLSPRASSDIEIGCVSEHHLEVTVDRIAREFGVNAGVSRPRVLYREAITRAADGEARHAKQVSERGEYGHVKVRLSPQLSDSGRLIEHGIVGGAIPGEFMPAVEQGVRDALEDGVLAGHPVEDVRVEIVGGSYHDVDSSDVAFRAAASVALQNALRNAEPVLMEPVMRVEVVAPAESEGDVTKNLVARRGAVRETESRGETRIIRAIVPMAELFGYESDLRRRTRGRGSFTSEFEAYVPVVKAADDDDRESPVGVPRPPTPKPRISGIALPEPDDDDQSLTRRPPS